MRWLFHFSVDILFQMSLVEKSEENMMDQRLMTTINFVSIVSLIEVSYCKLNYSIDIFSFLKITE